MQPSKIIERLYFRSQKAKQCNNIKRLNIHIGLIFFSVWLKPLSVILWFIWLLNAQLQRNSWWVRPSDPNYHSFHLQLWNLTCANNSCVWPEVDHLASDQNVQPPPINHETVLMSLLYGTFAAYLSLTIRSNIKCTSQYYNERRWPASRRL